MSIDIENHEYEALKNFDFKKYNFRSNSNGMSRPNTKKS